MLKRWFKPKPKPRADTRPCPRASICSGTRPTTRPVTRPRSRQPRDAPAWKDCDLHGEAHKQLLRCKEMLRSLRNVRRRMESLTRQTRQHCRETTEKFARCQECPLRRTCPTPAALQRLREQLEQELGDLA